MQDEITIDAQVQGGRPVVKGTRVTVACIFEALAAGDDIGEVARAYRLTETQVRSAFAYAAEVIAAERERPASSGQLTRAATGLVGLPTGPSDEALIEDAISERRLT